MRRSGPPPAREAHGPRPARAPRSARHRPGATFLVATLAVFSTLHLAVPALAAADEWLRYETDHFEIIYRAEDAAEATRVADLAPSVWERTTEFLQYRPSEPIPVVLYGRTARANGFFTPYPPHVALFSAAPAGPWMGARTEDWLESVFVHEVVHYLHLMQPTGFFGTASRVFGPLAAAGGTLFLPGWALEGPTTTAETWLTTGGRGRNPYFEMQWVAPILADEMYSYDQAGVGSAYPPRGRIYSAGYLLTDHLLREYGEEAFIELNREFQRWPFLGMRRALRRTIGRSGPEVHRDMVDSLNTRYAARRNLPAGTALAGTTDSGAVAPPREESDPLSERHLLDKTDLGAVAFHRGAFDPGSVQLLGDDGSWRHLAAVTPLDEYSVAISADGDLAAAAVDRANRAGVDGGPHVSSGDVYLIDVMEDSHRRVTTGARLFHPAIDGDGSTVIAVERTGRFSRVVTVDTDTGEITPIYAPPESFLSMPALSRDGRYLAVVENTTGSQSIVVLERGDEARYAPVYRIDVGEERDAEYRPRFAGARELWFVGDADGLLQLYRTTLPDREPANLPTIELILTDQVGVVAGAPDGSGSILYGTYRSTGHTVRRGLPTPYPVGTVKTEVRSESGVIREGPHADLPISSSPRPPITAQSQRYRDLPRPVLWVPTVRFGGEVAGTTRLDLGAGLIAVSTLGRHNLEAFAAYNPADRIPSGSVEYTYSPGPTALTLAATSDYTVTSDGSLRDVRKISLTLTRPVWYDENATHYRGLVGQLGTTYSSIHTEGDVPGSQHTSISGAARLLRYRYGGPGQIFGGTGGELQTAFSYGPEVATVTTASARLGRRTGRLHLKPAAAVATSDSGAALDNLPWRAPTFAPEGAGAIVVADAAALGRVALTVAAPPLDIAWRGLSLQNVGSSLYVSQAAGLDDTAGRSAGMAAVAGDNYSVAGAELTLHGQFNLVPLQLTAGVAVRLPHTDGAGPRRTQFYLNLGGAAVDQVSHTRVTEDRFITP
ncbi:MAG: hypothetical protein WD492_15540 [Alkalispirochaeta sp.]